MNRAEMLKMVPFYPIEELMLPEECPGCGHSRRTRGKFDQQGKPTYAKCEFYFPPACGRCPGMCEIMQDANRKPITRCTSCHEIRPWRG